MQSVTVLIACSAAGNVSKYRACMAAKQRTTMHYVHIPDFIAHHGSSTCGSGMAVVSDGEKQQCQAAGTSACTATHVIAIALAAPHAEVAVALHD
jgi:hypothetical protein